MVDTPETQIPSNCCVMWFKVLETWPYGHEFFIVVQGALPEVFSLQSVQTSLRVTLKSLGTFEVFTFVTWNTSPNVKESGIGRNR